MVIAFAMLSSVHTQIDRPAGAGMVVPVMMQCGEHVS
jgi:hypothetical protein